MANPLSWFLSFFRREASNRDLHIGLTNAAFVRAACGIIIASMYVAAGNVHQGQLKCPGPYAIDVGQEYINEKCWHGSLKRGTS